MRIRLEIKQLRYDINRGAAKRSELSGKIEKYEYFTSEDILPSNQSQIIEKAKFTYSPLWKALEKQTEKQVHALKSLNFSYKMDELKPIEGILPKHLLHNWIVYKFI